MTAAVKMQSNYCILFLFTEPTQFIQVSE